MGLTIALSWAEAAGLGLAEDTEIDGALVRWFNRLYYLGHLPHVGEKTLAALMHREAHFSRKGHGALRRTVSLARWSAAQRAHFNKSVDLVEALILGRGDQRLALAVH